MICSTCGIKVSKKETINCSKCGSIQCLKHVYYYVDPNNGRITDSSKGYCLECYTIIYKNI